MTLNSCTRWKVGLSIALFLVTVIASVFIGLYVYERYQDKHDNNRMTPDLIRFMSIPDNPSTIISKTTDFFQPEDISKNSVKARSSIICSNIFHGEATQDPLLTIITRVHKNHDNNLGEHVSSIQSQTNGKTIQHIILESQNSWDGDFGYGIHIYQDQIKGKYILIMDDNSRVSINFTEKLNNIIDKTSYPEVIVFRGKREDTGQECPSKWKEFPVDGTAFPSHILIRKDIFKNPLIINSLCREKSMDYAIIYNVFKHCKTNECRLLWFHESLVIIKKRRNVDQISNFNFGSVIPDLMGGLGNQLFMVSAAYGYQQDRHMDSIVFDTTVKTLTVGKHRPTYFDTIFKNWVKHEKNSDTKTTLNTIKEKRYAYDEIPKRYGTTKLSGYFQSYKYFSKYEEEIKNAVTKCRPKKTLSSYCEQPVDDSMLTVSMHIRLTDYVGADAHPIMPIEYYTKAMEVISKGVGGQKLSIIVYSDDLQEAKRKLPEHFEHLYGPLNYVVNGSDWEQLLSMGLCNHNITANSSFSWWGAYLNTHKQHIVAAPAHWFNDKRPEDWVGLYLPEWNIIHV